MIKCIIFDLDGVLIDSREMHYDTLNSAIEKIDPSLVISKNEHLAKYDGLSTTKKLQILNKEKNLDPKHFDFIWREKQKATIDVLDMLTIDDRLINIFSTLKSKGYQIGVCSNSIRNSVKISLLRLGVLEYVDVFLSNEDVSRPKPYPEIFWQCMKRLNTTALETLIIEDSHVGRTAALNSGANLLAVENSTSINLDMILNEVQKIDNKTQSINSVPWRDSTLNVLVPMAGLGSRFADAGYIFPKPLIEVNNKPMIQVVVENLNIEAHYIFIVQKEHYEKYNLKQVLSLISPGCDIIQIDGVTEGAACTTLMAKELINNSNPLLISNADQFLEWSANDCMYAFSADSIDGGILTFESTHPKWSFAKLGDDGLVCEVAEKKPISSNATCGVYYWKHGSDYVKYATSMIEKNIRTNNEFYVCPVFNEAIQDNKKIKIKHIDKMWGLGTPGDLQYFLDNYEKNS
jgi:HAD superfamily hydrolase (TIGR01509 family)